MKAVIAAVLCVLSLTAFAGDHRPGRSGGIQFDLRSGASADSRSSATARAEGGSAAAYGGASYAGGGEAFSGGNTLQVNEAKIPDDVRVRNVPDVTAIPAMTTANCIKGFGLGAGGAGFGGGLSWSVKDDECEGRAWAAHFLQTGRPQMAVNMECQVDRVRKANPRECGGLGR